MIGEKKNKKRKTCVRSRCHIFSPIIMKLGQNVCMMKCRTSSKMDRVGSKTRSLGQILEKLCVHCRGHISVCLL